MPAKVDPIREAKFAHLNRVSRQKGNHAPLWTINQGFAFLSIIVRNNAITRDDLLSADAPRGIPSGGSLVTIVQLFVRGNWANNQGRGRERRSLDNNRKTEGSPGNERDVRYVSSHYRDEEDLLENGFVLVFFFSCLNMRLIWRDVEINLVPFGWKEMLFIVVLISGILFIQDIFLLLIIYSNSWRSVIVNLIFRRREIVYSSIIRSICWSESRM